MLKYIRLKNWGPFKDEVEWHGDILNNVNKEYYDGGITSLAMIYGKNASGKTVFIEALKLIQRLFCGDGKIGFFHSDNYYNGPKGCVTYKDDPTEIAVEFATHDLIFRYEISLLLKQRSIVSEVLSSREADKPTRRFKAIYTREDYTTVKLNFDFGEFGKLLEKYFNEDEESLIHRLMLVGGSEDVKEISVPYNYMRDNLHFVNEDSFLATESNVDLNDIFIPNLMDKLEEMEVPIDGYELRERTDRYFLDLYSDESSGVKTLMNRYESDAVNIILCNRHGIFIITNTKDEVYKCYRLVLARNGIEVTSKGVINIAKLAIMSICTDDGVYIYDDFISSIDERYIEKFLELWKTTVRYKQFIGVSSNTNFMDKIDRADVSFVVQDKFISKILNPAKDLKWRHDKLLAKGYLEEI